MCFSANVSFGAAAALAAIGGVSVRGAPTRAHAPLAAIPLLFALQQAAEGGVWLVLAGAPWGKASTPIAQVFLFFALFLWPAYVPLSLYPLETSVRRRAALKALFLVGALLGAYLMACSTLRPSYVCIAYENLYYGVSVDGPLKPVLPFFYVATVAGGFLVSSARGTKLLAALLLASFGAAGVLFKVGFASVWCFFAAALSGVVALVARGAGLAARPR